MESAECISRQMISFFLLEDCFQDGVDIDYCSIRQGNTLSAPRRAPKLTGRLENP
jgi:hypothetical protein